MELSLLGKIKKFFRRITIERSYRLLYLYRRLENIWIGIFYSDKRRINVLFDRFLGKTINWENPKTFNEKLQWLKLYWRDSRAYICTDKYAVREYVAEKIGEEYLVKLHCAFDRIKDIDIDKLPESFVMKGSHGSGFNLICHDKSKIDWKKQFVMMRLWTKNNYYYNSREWVYSKKLKTKIICEELLVDEEVGDVRDYKIFCFNGVPKLIQVDFDRHVNHRRNVFDTEWNLLDVAIEFPKDHSVMIEKPEKLDEMFELSKKLSEGFPHVRVDFYYVNDKIYFGELTFFHGGGFEKITPKEFEITMGDWIELSNIVR